MIVEWVVGVVAGVLRWVIEAIPDVPVPSWLQGAADSLSSLVAYMSSLANWLPAASVMGAVAVAVFLCTSVGLGIKLARQILSLFTAGGGAA